MTNETKGIRKGLLMGIFAGAAAGSIIALLFAPKSGEKLRKDIRNKSQDFIDDADKYISNAKDNASQLIKDVKKKSESLVADAEKKVGALLDKSEKIMSDAKDKIGDYAQVGKVKLDKENERLQSAIKVGMDAYKTEKEA